jgi:hypothetical protein
MDGNWQVNITSQNTCHGARLKFIDEYKNVEGINIKDLIKIFRICNVASRVCSNITMIHPLLLGSRINNFIAWWKAIKSVLEEYKTSGKLSSTFSSSSSNSNSNSNSNSAAGGEDVSGSDTGAGGFRQFGIKVFNETKKGMRSDEHQIHMAVASAESKNESFMSSLSEEQKNILFDRSDCPSDTNLIVYQYSGLPSQTGYTDYKILKKRAANALGQNPKGPNDFSLKQLDRLDNSRPGEKELDPYFKFSDEFLRLKKDGWSGFFVGTVMMKSGDTEIFLSSLSSIFNVCEFSHWTNILNRFTNLDGTPFYNNITDDCIENLMKLLMSSSLGWNKFVLDNSLNRYLLIEIDGKNDFTIGVLTDDSYFTILNNCFAICLLIIMSDFFIQIITTATYEISKYGDNSDAIIRTLLSMGNYNIFKVYGCSTVCDVPIDERDRASELLRISSISSATDSQNQDPDFVDSLKQKKEVVAYIKQPIQSSIQAAPGNILGQSRLDSLMRRPPRGSSTNTASVLREKRSGDSLEKSIEDKYDTGIMPWDWDGNDDKRGRIGGKKTKLRKKTNRKIKRNTMKRKRNKTKKNNKRRN